MSEPKKCLRCGSEIPPEVSYQQCPKCLLMLAATCGEEEDAVSPERLDVSQATDWKRALPDYELKERLGSGGMGIVYRARQRSTNREVALKVIRFEETASPATIARFRQEAEAASRLDHPNIVAVYAIGEHEGNPYLVLQFIEGVSLARALRETASQATWEDMVRRRFPFTRVLALVARAVHYAHQHGLLHRDIKPSNILLDARGIPHLSDFGLAKFLDQRVSLTRTAELIGTPAYMAPEQAAGSPVTAASDVYSLGAMLYEILTGRPPFESEKPVEVLRQILEDDPKPPHRLNPLVDRALETICLKCLDKSPSQRYPSAVELASDLERWERNEPIQARPPGWLLRLERWVIRNPTLATLITGLLVGLGLTLSLLAKARDEQTRKSIALSILRTETARQLQEIWASPSASCLIKSETLCAMSGREPALLSTPGPRYCIGFVAEGNPLDRALRSAPLIEHLERRLSEVAAAGIRIDLRLYKDHGQATADLVSNRVDVLQLNALRYLDAKSRAPGLRPVASVIPRTLSNSLTAEPMVLFARRDEAIRTLSDLRGRSLLLGPEGSTMNFWAAVLLMEAGIRVGDLSSLRCVDSEVALFWGQPAPLGSPHLVPTLGNPYSDMTPIEAVLEGDYDAGLVKQRRFDQVALRERLVGLASFQDTPPLWVAAAEMSLPTLRCLQEALTMTTLDDPEALQAFPGNPRGFRICNEADFAPLQKQAGLVSSFGEESPSKEPATRAAARGNEERP